MSARCHCHHHPDPTDKEDEEEDQDEDEDENEDKNDVEDEEEQWSGAGRGRVGEEMEIILRHRAVSEGSKGVCVSWGTDEKYRRHGMNERSGGNHTLACRHLHIRLTSNPCLC